MAEVYDKENISPLRSPTRKGRRGLTPSPRKDRARSKSLEPADLEAPADTRKRRSPERNRRQSAFPKSNLPSKESKDEEAARKAARRKSLANRRVSFAPEATLHTWDVIEYLRDATTSSAASEEARRASGLVQSSPAANYQQEDDLPLQQDGVSPSRRSKRRRSSAIPPINFNNPDEILSSSPMTSSSPASMGDSDDSQDDSDVMDDEDEDNTAMSLTSAGNTAEVSLHSDASDASSRLDAVLREAELRSRTQNTHMDETGDMTMDMVNDETASFSPWSRSTVMMTPMAKNLMAVQEQENINPFSPAFRAQTGLRRPSIIDEVDEDGSMDMTRAIGAILSQPRVTDVSRAMDEETMEFTQAIGVIRDDYDHSPVKSSGLESAESDGRPSKRRRTSEAGSPARSSIMEPVSTSDQLVDVSMEDMTMDMTLAVGQIKYESSPARKVRRSSVARRRSTRRSVNFLEPTMDFTTAIGFIKPATETQAHVDATSESVAQEPDEDGGAGMEFTIAGGGILVPETFAPRLERSEAAPPDQMPMTPSEPTRLKEAQVMSATKLLTPIVVDQRATPESRKTRSSSKRKRDSSQSPSRPPAVQQSPLQPNHLDGTPSANLLDAVPSMSPSKPFLPGVQGQYPELVADVQLSSKPTTPRQTPKRSSKSDENPEILGEIRLATTPRQTSSPVKQVDEMTPKRTPARSTGAKSSHTPRSARSEKKSKAPRRMAGSQLEVDIESVLKNGQSGVVVRLNDFINAAGLNFMDLKTSKRDMAATTPARSTRITNGNPPAGHTLESAVVASICSVPELYMYEHACRELNRFISEGKGFVQDLDDQVYNNAAPLLRAFSQADATIKTRFDNHIRSVRSRARTESKQIWYGWRSQLLENVEQSLLESKASLELDSEIMAEKEALAAVFVPAVTEEVDKRQQVVDDLEAKSTAAHSNDQQALLETRQRLSETNATIARCKAALEDFRRQNNEKEQRLKELRNAKMQSLLNLEEASHVKERLRTVSLDEFALLSDNVANLQQQTGWSIESTRGTSVTMTYGDQLELFFDSSAFASSTGSKDGNATQHQHEDRPISLIYVADDSERADIPTERRFFLQMLQAHLQSLTQHQTPIREMLDVIAQTWDSALALGETLRKIRMEQAINVQILSDDRLGIAITIILPKVQTKVCIEIEITASISDSSTESAEGTFGIATEVDVRGRVVYGEMYNESTMASMIKKKIGTGVADWETPVRDLRQKLVAFGRKKG